MENQYGTEVIYIRIVFIDTQPLPLKLEVLPRSAKFALQIAVKRLELVTDIKQETIIKISM